MHAAISRTREPLKKRFGCKKKCNTTNLFDNFNQHHKALYDEYKTKSKCHPKQITISHAFPSVKPYEKFNIFSPGQYVLPSHTYFSQVPFPKCYEEFKA